MKSGYYTLHHGRPEGGQDGAFAPPWNSKIMLNILTFILIKKIFHDIMSYDSMRGCPK